MNRLSLENCIFVMIDIQDKFKGKIYNWEKIIHNANILNKAGDVMQIPLLITEQYPAGLGRTVSDIHIPLSALIYEKKKFSIFTPEISDWLKKQDRNQLVIFGIEAHVCVTQSCLDAIQTGYKVFLVNDAISSRTEDNKKVAIDRLHKSGCEIVSTEMILFELMQTAEFIKFKEISGLIK